MPERARLAVDIGGTFTDFVLETPHGTSSAKVLTTPAAPEQAVLEGLPDLLAAAGVDASELALVIHGTTLATNALIERKGARTALVATDGFRDAVEMAYEHRFEQYDLYMERPAPLVPRSLRFGVRERIAADGAVLAPLDEAAVEALATTLAAENIESVAIGFLHSYANGAHEARAAELLAARLPDVSITLSSEVCPEIREYERFSTACANAYVQPLMARYLTAMRAGLAELGATCPLLLMMSSGGVTTVETAVRQPVRLIESGPAGGVILAQGVAGECGVADALSFDMGGTTAKLTLINDGRPQLSRTFEVARQYRFLKGSGLPVRIPVIDMVEIGAGGGSIARIDELRRVTVGPDSAGADPGPACYPACGTEATVTDADLVLGRIDPQGFAGGKIPLAPQRASAAIARSVGAPLAMNEATAAAAIVEIVDETMASAARVHAVENGTDTAGRHLIATGGAAPLHAARLAQKLGIDTIVIPAGAGVGSAHGFLRAPIAYEVVRTRLTRLDALEPAVVNDLFGAMRAEAEGVVRLGSGDAALEERREAFMRYRGQGHEITVPLPMARFDATAPATLTTLFHERYEAVFGRIIPDLDIEVVTWALTLGTRQVPPTPSARPETIPAPEPEPSPRAVFNPVSGQTMQAAVHPRGSLAPGHTLAGPAVIIEDETTTIVPQGFRLEVITGGHLLLTRQETDHG